jgi:uncharacterized protein (DUF486 family)
MTFARQGHPKGKPTPHFAVILNRRGITFFACALQVVANHIWHGPFSAASKTIQGVATHLIFAVFSVSFKKKPS